MKHLAILGSTGSIGVNALRVAQHLHEEMRVVALAAHSNIDLLEQQARLFSPEIVAVYDKQKAIELQRRLPGVQVVAGMEGLEAAASYSKVNFVVSAITGTMGLAPTVAAVKAGKNIGLANKEALVSGGALVMSLVKKKGVQLIPIDSEHSALYQCLNGENIKTVQRLILTASGGPFRNYSQDQLGQVTVEQALCHPRWKMGPKVTIDCSTMMNKGLEVIEAHWLFGIPINQIEVVIHPQSIIHSLVEFIDNSLLAQLGETDMIIPIQYALTYPNRRPGLKEKFDFVKYGNLQFFQPDFNKFSCLRLAFDALKTGGTMPCYMNAANEVLVQRFLKKEIGWNEIAFKLERLMLRHQAAKIHSLDDIFAIDLQAREEAQIH
jgi:1-deoxy-D-xylulose-5-phosphate reductoisomerase